MNLQYQMPLDVEHYVGNIPVLLPGTVSAGLLLLSACVYIGIMTGGSTVFLLFIYLFV